ncbi:DUF3892 domain-containing protein [Gymnodinialimonas mytili]|uniref:DUF3892 domain-containing protein n=1 Tax=Gymnodinialimonas mytili TaxID=3126503 RepID=UPI003F70530E
MARTRRISVTKEGPTGLNTRFKVAGRGCEVSRSKLVKEVKQGQHPGYHTRHNGRVEYVASNPDGSKRNNLD